MSKPTVDQIYYWKGFGDGLGQWESYCRLRIWQPHPEQTIVMLSDEGLDSGTSITNCVEYIAPKIAAEFELDPQTTDWIEHYPGYRQERSGVEFSRVHLQWREQTVVQVHWSPLSQQETECLVAQPL